MTDRIPSVCAVTGASGYVGSIIMQKLRQHLPVVAMVRHPQSEADISWSLESGEDIAPALRARNVKTLVHAAWDMRANSLLEMEKTCVQGSAALFDAAARAGVERIVFVSSISAFEGCRSAYGKSKLMVEKLLRGSSNIVFRFGLVFGGKPGGVFGGIRRQVQNSRILPLIGGGLSPQYLLHEKTLAESILRAVSGDFDRVRAAPITLAHPEPWRFRDLVKSIAASEGRRVALIPVPWWLLFAGIRTGEALGLNLPFRSDSVISFVHYDRSPDFSLMHSLGIKPLPYKPG
ncbi:MAG: NAD-dependent epimerase/dehydratase family protein [Terracidiphilus sp.]|jgi:nucleoside-diphosphate-sugar epimerase